jgi:hypothetical protein
VSTGQDDLEAWKRRRTAELAFELADTGRYENFADIAYALQFERGMSSAQALIDDPEIRRQLNARCGDARERLAPLAEVEVVEANPEGEVEALHTASHATLNDHAELPQAADFAQSPSVLRRVLLFWRTGVKPVGARDLESAAS